MSLPTRAGSRLLLTLAGGALAMAMLLALVAASLGQAPAEAQEGGMVLRPFVEGLNRPVYVTHAGDGSGDLYIVERDGLVLRAGPDGTLEPDPILDITDQVSLRGEHGLLSIAFPPGGGPKDHFFAYYVSLEGNGTITLSRFEFDGTTAGDETVLVEVPHGHLYHVGGTVAFGPDGLLYFATGDGGGSGDPYGNSQDYDTNLAKLLRIDPYAPAPITPEVLGIGLRNPFRFAFDVPGERLYLSDVGQEQYEEVNFVPLSALGGEVENYGWNIVEGDQCYNAETCDMSGLVMPDIVYSHDVGCSIIGGPVYRGSWLPALEGRYVYGDYCSGDLMNVPGDLSVGLGMSSITTDAHGELYITEIDDANPTAGNGVVWRLEPEIAPTVAPTEVPTESPTEVPTETPTEEPTVIDRGPFQSYVPYAARDAE